MEENIHELDLIEYKKMLRDSFVIKYLDSLEGYKPGGVLPKFLENCEFDYDNSEFWEGLHSPISLRMIILSKVKNKLILIEIINSSNKSYDCISKFVTDKSQYVRIPYDTMSFRQIAKLKIDSLDKI